MIQQNQSNRNLISLRHRTFSWISFASFSLILAIGLSGTIFAQDFQEIKVDETLAAQKNSVLGGSANSGDVNKFYQNYYLGRWTVQSNAKNIHKFRAEISEDAANLSGDAKSEFLSQILKRLTTFALNKEYYPACRFNAVLAIGTLDETLAPDKNSSPVPYAPAIKMLAGLADSNKYNLPDYVRYGALLGLERHAELGVADDKTKSQIKTIFLDVLKSSYATEKVIRDEIYFSFKFKAVEGLAAFHSPDLVSGDAVVLNAMKKILEDKNADSDVRALAAQAIGTMNFDSVKDYDFASLATSIGTLAANFCQDEIDYINTEQMRDQIKTGTGASSGMGMGGGAMGGMDMGGGMGAMGGGMGMGGGAMGAMSGGMGMGGGAMGAMSGGMGMGGGAMGGMNVDSIENAVLVVKYHIDSLQIAMNGADKKSGVKAMIPADATDAQKLLDNVNLETQRTLTFLSTGSTETEIKKTTRRNRNAMLMVDLSMIQDHLNEQLIRYNELIGIED